MKAVEHAVLLAAGRGTRLGALTDATPKPLLTVGNVPILHRIVDGLAAAGIRDFSIVTGYRADEIESATGDGSRWGVHIRYFRQQKLEGTARALELVRRHLLAHRFYVGWGDIVVEPWNYRRLLSAARHSACVLAVNEVDDPAEGAAVYVDESMRVTRIVEKPAPGTSTTRWNNAGLAVLDEHIWRAIDHLVPSSRGEYELPQAVAALIDQGTVFQAIPIEGPWFDIGTPANLTEARRHFGA